MENDVLCRRRTSLLPGGCPIAKPEKERSASGQTNDLVTSTLRSVCKWRTLLIGSQIKPGGQYRYLILENRLGFNSTSSST